jgi:fatty-acyl-CoA synthase
MSFQPPTSQTIPTLLSEQVQRFGERPALVAGPHRLNYSQLRREVMRTAAGLHALGVRRGDHVGILMGNRQEWVLSFLALQQLGAVTVGLNTWATPREFVYALTHAQISVLVCVDRFKRTPILVLTTESSDEMKQAGRAAGATGWMVKPFDPARLLEVIGRVLPQ